MFCSEPRQSHCSAAGQFAQTAECQHASGSSHAVYEYPHRSADEADAFLSLVVLPSSFCIFVHVPDYTEQRRVEYDAQGRADAGLRQCSQRIAFVFQAISYKAAEPCYHPCEPGLRAYDTAEDQRQQSRYYQYMQPVVGIAAFTFHPSHDLRHLLRQQSVPALPQTYDETSCQRHRQHIYKGMFQTCPLRDHGPEHLHPQIHYFQHCPQYSPGGSSQNCRQQ